MSYKEGPYGLFYRQYQLISIRRIAIVTMFLLCMTCPFSPSAASDSSDRDSPNKEEERASPPTGVDFGWKEGLHLDVPVTKTFSV